MSERGVERQPLAIDFAPELGETISRRWGLWLRERSLKMPLSSAGVKIFVGERRYPWEVHIIRGALFHQGISSTLARLSDFGGSEDDDFCVVLLPSQTYALRSLKCSSCEKPVIVAGHCVTLQYLRHLQPPPENAILLYGEPYRTLPELVRNRTMIEEARGKAILGELFDPREYTAADAGSEESTLILTSVGCRKRCAYCTYGSTYLHLYGSAFSRRSRPWEDIRAELITGIEAGIEHFHMCASQFLSEDPKENWELANLASHWDHRTHGRPVLTFTVSPVEVLRNAPLLEDMARSFYLAPSLSIDSLDSQALALFDRNYSPEEAMEALKALTRLRTPLKINYIFIRPGIDIRCIKRELEYLKLLATETSYLSDYGKLLMAYDIFSNSLSLDGSAPIASKRGVGQSYESQIPREVSGLVSKIQDSLAKQIKDFDNGARVDPLAAVVNVIDRYVNSE